MNRTAFLIILILCIISCNENDNPCDILVDGVYQFPELPEDHDMTSEEVTHYWDLPEDIGTCISTEGLIETCLSYPDLRLIMAGSNPQQGYETLVRARFLGVRILETRPDRGSCLLKKYQTIAPSGYDPNWELVEIGRYLFNVYNFEIIFSQQDNLEPLTDGEIIELLEKALSVYKEKKDDIENHALFGLEVSTTLLGRLMLQEEYEPFLNVYEENKLVEELINYYGHVDMETVELVFTLSKNFLNQLKNN